MVWTTVDDSHLGNANESIAISDIQQLPIHDQIENIVIFSPK